MKATASTTLSFGLVNAPVQLFKATSNPDVTFNLCAPDGSPVEQVYRKKGSDDIVGTSKDCGKMHDGFQIDKEVLKAIDTETKQEGGKSLKKLNINSFIPLDKVPFNRVTGWYYVGNDPKNGDIEAFATIVQAMDQKKLAAVTKWVPRTRHQMIVLYVQDGMMFAVSVAFAASVQEPPVTSTDPAKVKVDPAVVDMAITFIETKVDEEASDLEQMTDNAVTKRKAMVEAVKNGETVQVADVEEEAPAGEDLMAKLKASIDATVEV